MNEISKRSEVYWGSPQAGQPGDPPRLGVMSGLAARGEVANLQELPGLRVGAMSGLHLHGVVESFDNGRTVSER